MTASQPVALVTGASSGIGKAATLSLRAAGFQVIGTSRDTSRLTPGDGVTLLDLDVTRDESMVRGDTPMPVYAQRQRIFDELVAESMRGGDDPGVVAEVIATAATDPKPKLLCTAGPTARRISVLRRIVPARSFDKSIRKLYRLPA